MWVFKLGGSIGDDPALRQWLEQLLLYGGGRAVIVPGGGAFADQVRAAQQLWGFPDATAHRMALLAMDQYGLMLQGMCPACVTVASEAELNEALKAAAVPIWLPAAMLANCPEVPSSWSVTSDSIAAWLAGRLNAERLVLVKSCDPPAQPMDAREMAELGIVDAAFPDFVRNACFETLVVHKNSHGALPEMLYGDSAPARDADFGAMPFSAPRNGMR